VLREEGRPGIHELVHSSKRLQVVSLGLDGSLGEVLPQISEVGMKIRDLRETAEGAEMLALRQAWGYM